MGLDEEKTLLGEEIDTEEVKNHCLYINLAVFSIKYLLNSVTRRKFQLGRSSVLVSIFGEAQNADERLINSTERAAIGSYM